MIAVLNKAVVVVAEKIVSDEYGKDLWKLKPEDQKAFVIRAALNCGMDGEDTKKKLEGFQALADVLSNKDGVKPSDLAEDTGDDFDPFFAAE